MAADTQRDGQVNRFGSTGEKPRIYFVNGVRTTFEGHSNCAQGLVDITERVIFGVYNSTEEMAPDFFQSIGDYGFNLLNKHAGTVAKVAATVSPIMKGMSKFAEPVKKQLEKAKACPPLPKNDPIAAVDMLWKLLVSEDVRRDAAVAALKWNKAAHALFLQLSSHRKSWQMVIAHSQGNLISANSLWAMAVVYGYASLSPIQMYSLSSPTMASAWPPTLLRKSFGYANDPITWLDPHNWHFPGQGHPLGWRNLSPNFAEGIYNPRNKHEGEMGGVVDAHGAGNVIFDQFVGEIRRDLRLPALTAARKAELHQKWRRRW